MLTYNLETVMPKYTKLDIYKAYYMGHRAGELSGHNDPAVLPSNDEERSKLAKLYADSLGILRRDK